MKKKKITPSVVQNLQNPQMSLEDAVSVLKSHNITMTSHNGASRTRRSMSQWRTSAKDANSDNIPDLPVLRSRARDADRNKPIATGATNIVTINVVGTGLKLQSRIGRKFLNIPDAVADKLQSDIEREFAIWAESTNCDASDTQNFYQLQDLVCRNQLVNGDSFVLMPFFKRFSGDFGLKIQTIESDRISNPDNKTDSDTLAGGIELDQYGAPAAYHIQVSHPGAIRAKRAWVRVEKRGKNTGRPNVLHLFHKTRSGQCRGVPFLSPVLEAIHVLDKYSESELMAAVVSALFTVFVKTEAGDGFAPIEPVSESGSTSSDDTDKLVSGAIINLAPGESIETANPGRPNVNFDPFFQAVLSQIGAAIGIPFEVLRMHFSSSYSASRAALLEAWKLFTVRRTWIASGFCQPVFEAWMVEAVATGRINAPGFLLGGTSVRAAYLQADWIGPAQGSIDPLKEANAATVRISTGLSSLSDEVAATGKDWETVHRQQVMERRVRLEGGLVQEIVDPGNENQKMMIEEEDKDE